MSLAISEFNTDLRSFKFFCFSVEEQANAIKRLKKKPK